MDKLIDFMTRYHCDPAFRAHVDTDPTRAIGESGLAQPIQRQLAAFLKNPDEFREKSQARTHHTTWR